jgi:exonuclease VII large subunit
MNRPIAPSTPSLQAAPAAMLAAEVSPALEETLAAVETRLANLAEALRERDLSAIDQQSTELHRALQKAVDHFSRAARSGPIPMALRLRLARTSGSVAAQRESFARATAALDRAIDVLLPREAPALYGAHGATGRNSLGGVAQA